MHTVIASLIEGSDTPAAYPNVVPKRPCQGRKVVVFRKKGLHLRKQRIEQIVNRDFIERTTKDSIQSNAEGDDGWRGNVHRHYHHGLLST
jgi:hypothetical protein